MVDTGVLVVGEEEGARWVCIRPARVFYLDGSHLQERVIVTVLLSRFTVISRRLRIKVAKTLDVNVPGKSTQRVPQVTGRGVKRLYGHECSDAVGAERLIRGFDEPQDILNSVRELEETADSRPPRLPHTEPTQWVSGSKAVPPS